MQSEKISQTIPDWAQFSQGHGKKIKAKNILITQNLKMLLSVRAPTSQANILYLDQKAVKCMTCKWLYDKF